MSASEKSLTGSELSASLIKILAFSIEEEYRMEPAGHSPFVPKVLIMCPPGTCAHMVAREGFEPSTIRLKARDLRPI
jgi:hypothetical protein